MYSLLLVTAITHLASWRILCWHRQAAASKYNIASITAFVICLLLSLWYSTIFVINDDNKTGESPVIFLQNSGYWNPMYSCDGKVSLMVFTTQLGSGTLRLVPMTCQIQQTNCQYAVYLYWLKIQHLLQQLQRRLGVEIAYVHNKWSISIMFSYRLEQLCCQMQVASTQMNTWVIK